MQFNLKKGVNYVGIVQHTSEPYFKAFHTNDIKKRLEYYSRFLLNKNIILVECSSSLSKDSLYVHVNGLKNYLPDLDFQKSQQITNKQFRLWHINDYVKCLDFLKEHTKTNDYSLFCLNHNDTLDLYIKQNTNKKVGKLTKYSFNTIPDRIVHEKFGVGELISKHKNSSIVEICFNGNKKKISLEHVKLRELID